jgi:anti-anti-sigma factor
MSRAAELNMTEKSESGRTRLILTGELDLNTVRGFEEQLGVLRAKKRRVRLDLSKLDFIDAAGLRAVLRAKRDRRGGLSSLEVDPKLSPQVNRLVALLGCPGAAGGT